MYYLERKAEYFGRTTPIIRWIVKTDDKTALYSIVAEYTTKKEAVEFINALTSR
jgi:hypothetical protein